MLAASSRNHIWKGVSSVDPSFPFRRREFGSTNNPPLQKTSSKSLPSRPKPPPEEEIEESFLKGSGPGGQKIVRLLQIPIALSSSSWFYVPSTLTTQPTNQPTR